jgi:hypothetical protein
VGSTVDDIECGCGKDKGSFDTGKVSEVLVKRDTLLSSASFSDSNRNTEDGVGAELGFVGGTVKFDEEVVDFGLGGDRDTSLDELGGDNIVDIGDSLADT